VKDFISSTVSERTKEFFMRKKETEQLNVLVFLFLARSDGKRRYTVILTNSNISLMIAKYASIASITFNDSCNLQVELRSMKRLSSVSVTPKEELHNANTITDAELAVNRFRKTRVILVSAITNVIAISACKKSKESSDRNIAVNHAMNSIAITKREGE
jgi:hypothetical protein